MSDTNFVGYGDAETVLSEYAQNIKNLKSDNEEFKELEQHVSDSLDEENEIIQNISKNVKSTMERVEEAVQPSESMKADITAAQEDIAAIQAVIPYKIDRVRYNLANTDFPSSLVGSDIVTWLNARATDSVFKKPGIHIVELYNTATDNYGYFFIQNLGTQGADTVAGYGVAEFKTYYTAGGRPYYFLLKQSTWSLMHDANNMYLERSNLTPTATTVTLSPTDNTADNVTLHLRKTGNVVTATYFNSRIDNGTLKTNWTSIGTIPTGYRPVETVYTTVNHANSHNVTVGLQFNSNGTIAQYSYATGNLGYERSVNLTWITG